MNFRLSRITDHNKFKETDHLYDPLRDAINRSISKGKNLNRVSSAHDLQRSVVSKQMIEFSSEQAKQMEKNIYIPTDRRLHPTHHLDKIKGRHFHAIDVQEKQGPSISEEELKRRFHGEDMEEIVYEFSESAKSKPQSPRIPTPQNQRTSGGIHLLKKAPINRESDFSKKEGRLSRNTDVKFKQTDIFSEKPRQSLKNIQSKQSASGIIRLQGSNAGSRAKFRESQSNRNGVQNSEDKGSPKQGSNLQEGKVKGGHEGSSVTSSVTSSSKTSSRMSKYGRSQSQYKYNLFSSMDEAVNTKCGSFGKHELVASKPKQSWE